MGKYGMPYQGSKSSICDKLLNQLPKAENFYDLFGGGGAVSHAAALSGKYKNVFYNEIDSKITRLFRDAIAGKYSYEDFKPEWVSREEFHNRKTTDGYVALCWSFSNDQQTYLFSESIEPYKKSMHQAIVFEEFDELSSQVLGFDKWGTECIKERRLFLRKKIEQYRKTRIPEVLYPFLNKNQLGQLEQIQQLRRLQQLQQLESLERLQQLELLREIGQLERLHRLQQLESLERLRQLQQLKGCTVTTNSEDYRNIPILPNSVVYCDIPYKDTRGYSTPFDRRAFLDWAANAPFPVYISEYQLEDPFLEMFITEKRVLKCGSIEGKEKANEKLYWNMV